MCIIELPILSPCADYAAPQRLVEAIHKMAEVEAGMIAPCSSFGRGGSSGYETEEGMVGGCEPPCTASPDGAFIRDFIWERLVCGPGALHAPPPPSNLQGPGQLIPRTRAFFWVEGTRFGGLSGGKRLHKRAGSGQRMAVVSARLAAACHIGCSSELLVVTLHGWVHVGTWRPLSTIAVGTSYGTIGEALGYRDVGFGKGLRLRLLAD